MTEFQESQQRSKKHFRRMLIAFITVLLFGFATFFAYQAVEYRAQQFDQGFNRAW